MKSLLLMCVLLLTGASSAGAVDIKGKWGIGAGVFGGGGEVSLIRGRSERSAWLFDVGVQQKYEEEGGYSSRSTSFLAGPGYRRFVRPDDSLTPYWDLRARGRYGRASSIGIRTEAGAEFDFSFGMEYFTPWRFSVAAHTSAARLVWVHYVTRREWLGTTLRTTRDFESFSVGLSPALFVRAYF